MSGKNLARLSLMLATYGTFSFLIATMSQAFFMDSLGGMVFSKPALLLSFGYFMAIAWLATFVIGTFAEKVFCVGIEKVAKNDAQKPSPLRWLFSSAIFGCAAFLCIWLSNSLSQATLGESVISGAINLVLAFITTLISFVLFGFGMFLLRKFELSDLMHHIVKKKTFK